MTLIIVLKVKFKVTKMKPIYDFLLVSNSNYVLIVDGLQDIVHKDLRYVSTYELICIFQWK